MKKLISSVLFALLITLSIAIQPVQPAFASDPQMLAIEAESAAVNSTPINVMNFGASGSIATTTGSISSGSNVLALASAQDFENGEGIIISNAGPAPTISAPTSLSVKPTIGTPSNLAVGTIYIYGGATSYSYTVIAVDAVGGHTAAPAVQSISTASSTLNSTYYNTITCTAFSGAVHYAWYRTASGGSLSATGYIGETTSPTINDTGLSVITPPAGVPSSPPASGVGHASYTYSVAAMDANGAITSSVSASTSSAWATLSATNYIYLLASHSGSVSQYVWWRTFSNEAPSTTGFIGVGLADAQYWDWGTDVNIPASLMSHPYSIPNTAPASALAAPLITTISSGGGSTTLILATNVGSKVSGALIQHDDSAALQATFNQGGNILIPAGNYNVFKTIIISNSDMNIYGAGIDKTIIINHVTIPNYWYGGSPYTIATIDTSEIINIYIHDMTFNGDYFEGNNYDGVYLTNCDSSSIYRCKTINSAGNCLLISSNDTVGHLNYNYPGLKSVVDCTAYNCSGEVFASWDSDNVLLANNTGSNFFEFTISGKDAWLQVLDIESSINCTITGNSLYNIPYTPWGFSNGVQDCIQMVYALNTTITDNLFKNQSGSGNAVSLDTGGPLTMPYEVDNQINFVLDHNQFINVGGMCVYIDQATVNNIKMTNNNITSGELIIDLSGNVANNIDISSNTIDNSSCDNNGTTPIEIFGSGQANNITINNNKLNCKGMTKQPYYGNDPAGMYLNNCNDLIVSDNVISAPVRYGIEFGSISNFTIDANIIDYTNSSGLDVACGIGGNAVTNGVFSKNTVIGSVCSLGFSSPYSIIVSDNNFANGSEGISLFGKGSGLSIVNNNLIGDGDYNMIDPDCANEIISGNLGYNPTGSQTPSASLLLSGMAYQNTYDTYIDIYQPAYATGSGTAGTVSVALGSSSSPATLYTQQIPGSTTSSQPGMVELRVPPGWYYKFTSSGATLSIALIEGD